MSESRSLKEVSSTVVLGERRRARSIAGLEERRARSMEVFWERGGG